MGRHNRDGRGLDQAACEYEISYPPDWLSHVKVTRLLEHGRQSTMTLFRNPEPPAKSPGKQVRTRIKCEELGLDVEVILKDPAEQVVRVSVEAAPPKAKGVDRSVTLTLNGHGESE